RLIQRNLMQGEASALHLAEIFLSGLIRSEWVKSQEKTQLRYNFVSGVRPLLLKSVPISETEMVLEEVADEVLETLPEEVRNRISEDIERRLGKSWRSFEAFLLPNLPWEEYLEAEMLSFAQITSEALKTLGGEYAETAQRLERTAAVADSVSTPPISFPSLRDIEFETIFVDLEEIPLQSFNFKVATVEVRPAGRRKTPQVVIQKQQGQAWGYTEQLGETVVLEMVAIPEGTFVMGSPADEPERYGDEGPTHEVRVPAFFMGKYPVTQAQWKWVAALDQIERPLDPDPSQFKVDNHPVERVSWLDAQEFCARLAQHTGKDYRLPSEAEWEYACRAGTTSPFHFGETITPKLANYDWSRAYGVGSKQQSGSKGTTPVGSFEVANGFGLYDMHGNVWEWCEDDWHDSYENAPNDGSAWISESRTDKSLRVRRGGSWIDIPWYCRSAYRDLNVAGVRSSNYGFRVCCVAPRTL
ncbi:MAG: formylglycine-generating enzyme family protein, partial [Leptolyngbyaceae cyanobacterium bins.59]|nr:formylglycine-generating enzyme family protein [Leptolyngbyaceae cyanobacterium bins.59]